MASKALSPETPPKSGECCLFKLPPELRVVIYNMVFEGICFDGEEGLEEAREKRLEEYRRSTQAMKEGTSREDHRSSSEDYGAGDEEENSDDEDDASDERRSTSHEEDSVNGDHAGDSEEADETSDEEASAVIETEDSEANYDQDNEEEVQASNDNQDDQDHDALSSGLHEDSYDFERANGENLKLHLTRPPLLGTCRLIREEAIPVCNQALTLLAVRKVKSATISMIQIKENLIAMENMGIANIAFTTWMQKKVTGIALVSTLRVAVILNEIDDIETSVEGSTTSDARAAGRLNDVIEDFKMLTVEILDY